MTINFGSNLFGGHSGSAPSPFDALNGPQLAGSQGSHPLHNVRAEDLVTHSHGDVSGQIVLDGPVRVGESIDGTIHVTATDRIEARSAVLRLRGLRLDEVRRSVEDRDSQGRVTRTDQWVEADGRLFADDAFTDAGLPSALEPGQSWEGHFSIPAPSLGPPCAHLGESIIAWAVEAHWDIARGGDHFLAAYVPVLQNVDLVSAGVGKQGGMALLDEVSVGGAVIGITSPLPAPNGTELAVRAAWPGAPGGQKARIELHRRTNAPNGVEGIIATMAIEPATLSSGTAEVRLLVPAGSPPSFDGAGLEIVYIVRVLIDRRFQSDAAIERPVAIV
jgi:hypothetical protein